MSADPPQTPEESASEALWTIARDIGLLVEAVQELTAETRRLRNQVERFTEKWEDEG